MPLRTEPKEAIIAHYPIHYKSMPDLQNIKDLSDAVTEQRKNFIVEEVNDNCMRLAINHEEYPWHYHSNSDELFVVLEGELTVKFRDREPVTLQPNDSLLVPAGVVHKTCPKGRTVNLCFEKSNADTQFVEVEEADE